MPLNPNGKIDKPALPFPDTAQAASIEPQLLTTRRADPTEESIRSIWSHILPNPPIPIPLDENFFDLGGHSILATRFIFELRKSLVVDAPLGLIFERPTVGGLAAAVDALRNADLGLDYKEQSANPTSESAQRVAGVQEPFIGYGRDCDILVKELKPEYPPLPESFGMAPLTVFLTGATGFLDAFVLRDLLRNINRVKKVYCLVRASDSATALDRLRQGANDKGVWEEHWTNSPRLQVLCGDLNQKSFGLGQNIWDTVAAEADVVVHNGALVRGFNLHRYSI